LVQLKRELDKMADSVEGMNSECMNQKKSALHHHGVDLTTTEGRRFANGLIFVCCVMLAVGLGIISPVLPIVIIDLFDNDKGAAARFSGYMDTTNNLISMLFGSWALCALSDSFGRRPFMLFGMFGYCFSIILQICAIVSRKLWLIFLSKTVSGVTANFITMCFAYVADISVAGAHRSNGFGALGAAVGVGFVIGPFIGGWMGNHCPSVLGHSSYIVPFFVAAALQMIVLLIVLFMVPESLPKSSRSPFSLVKINPIFAIKFLFERPAVRLLCYVVVLFGFADADLQSTFVYYTSSRFGWQSDTLGSVYSFLGVIGAINQGVTIRFALSHLGEQRTILTGFCILGLAHLMYGLSTQSWMMITALVVGSTGAVCNPVLTGLLSKTVGECEQGALQGALSVLGSISGLVAPILMTHIFSYFNSPDAPVHLPGAAFFLGAILFFVTAAYAASVFRRREFFGQSDVSSSLESQQGKDDERAPLLANPSVNVKVDEVSKGGPGPSSASCSEESIVEAEAQAEGQFLVQHTTGAVNQIA